MPQMLTLAAVVPAVASRYSGEEDLIMKYVYLLDGKTVHDIQPGKSKDFPDKPIKDRFSAEYLANCVEVKDSVEVESGLLYDSESGTFSAPPVVEPAPMTIEEPVAAAAFEEIQPSVMETLTAKIAEQETRIAALENGNKSFKAGSKHTSSVLESYDNMAEDKTVTQSEVTEK